MKNILFLSNPRSFNKAVASLKALSKLGCTAYILTNRIPTNSEIKNLQNFNHIMLVADFENFNSIIQAIHNKNINFVCVLSENLLTLQNKIEQYLNLPESMPLSSAKILSDKFLFDTFCKNNNISVPNHLLIKTLKQFDFNYQCITKATIGSGQYYTIKKNSDYFEYKKFTSGRQFKDYLIDKNLIDDFLNANNTGLKLDRYANVPLQFYTQEYITASSEYCTSGVIIDSKPYFYFTGELIKYAEGNLSYIDEMHHEGILQDSTEHLAYIMNKPDPSLIEKFINFYTIIISKLKIKNMFFSGPDIYSSNGTEYYIDLNCRISGQFNKIVNRVGPDILLNTWKSLLFGNQLVDYCIGQHGCTGYPIIPPGTYIRQKNLYHHDIEFLNFDNILTVPDLRRNMDNKDIKERIVIFSDNNDFVSKYKDATRIILDAYKKNTFL